MAMLYGPDFDSDSGDSFYDDYNYFSAGHNNRNQSPVVAELSAEQLHQLKLDNFYQAISNDNINDIVQLLDDGIAVDADLKDGWTGLLLASCCGKYELVELLILKGADVNQVREEMTALMLACSCPYYTCSFEKTFKVIELLVEKETRVNAFNKKRITALMFAATSGNLLAVKYLLPLSQKGALDNQGWNALTYAVSSHQIEVIKYLLDQGFDCNITDIRGETVYEIARDNGLHDVLEILPKKHSDTALQLVETNADLYKDLCEGFKKHEKPQFFNEVCNILTSINCDHLVPIFLEKNVSLEQFLSVNDEELKEIGISLPVHRLKILQALRRFHLRPYHPKSINICVNNAEYTNLDLATQLTSAVQQIIVMESSLKFIQKNLKGDLSEEDKKKILQSIAKIKKNIRCFRLVNKKLNKKICEWDKLIQPPDLINKNSIKSKIPWKKLSLCFGLLSLVILLKTKF